MPEDGHNIGFNDQFESGQRLFQIQTEVVGRAEMKVVTTVMADGMVLHSERHPYPADLVDIERVRALIEAKHKQVVDRVTRGEIK